MTETLTALQTRYIETAKAHYPIHYVHSAEELVSYIQDMQAQFWITDKGLAEHMEARYPQLQTFLAAQSGSSAYMGETFKTQYTLLELYQALLDTGVERSQTIACLGGGACSDLTGFLAATYMRGINYHIVPTTLLSMVDSCIGGKTGINLLQGKNLIGAIHHPCSVVIWSGFLQTLPEREFASGMAEIIKYALIEPSLWSILTNNGQLSPKTPEILDVIAACGDIKANIVAEDEDDRLGIRAVLNLGHTFAHAIEQVTEYEDYTHGEAVSIGLVLAARYGKKMAGFADQTVDTLTALLESYNLPTRLKQPLALSSLLTAMGKDKKRENGSIRLIIPREIGDIYIEKQPDIDTVCSLWREAGAK